ncbi:MAG: class I adenylate-forming enzyme family protein [Usitatibacter sp.]
MRLIERVLQSVERSPDAPAFIANDKPITYRALLALLSNAVSHLHRQGVRAGDPVALTMSQSPLHVITFLALARLGALVVPVTPFLRPEDKLAVFRKFEIRTAVSDRTDAGVAGCKLILLGSMGARGNETALDAGGFQPDDDTPLRIALTSGTTGPPKGVLFTHRTFVARLDRMQCHVVEIPRVLPPNLHSTAPLNLALHALCLGGAVVFPAGYDNVPFFDAIRRHGVTHVGLPPANLALMLAALPEGGPHFPSVRHLRIMGGTPGTTLVQLALRRFTDAVYVSYGLGETGHAAMATPATLAREPRSAGLPGPGVRIEVLDEAGRALPAGATGEIRVSIPGMPTGYFGPDAGDRSRFRDGWFYPGDRGHLSPEGLVFLEGRIDDIINMGGRKVSPSFVESVLEDHPSVREAAVFVAGEGVGGTRIAAAIVPAGPIDWSALNAYALRELDVRAPVAYYEAASLPRNAMGKLQRAEITRLRDEGPGRIVQTFPPAPAG